MKEDIKEQWVKALRSRGYRQIKRALKMDTGHDALGVLCELYVRDTGNRFYAPPPHIEGENVYHLAHELYDETNFLPKPVSDWAGIRDNDPFFKIDDGTPVRISTLNDEGWTFDQLADLIEKQL